TVFSSPVVPGARPSNSSEESARMCFSRSSVSMLSSADLRSAPGGFSATSGGFPAQEEPSAEIMATIHTVFLIIVSPENSRHLYHKPCVIGIRLYRLTREKGSPRDCSPRRFGNDQ